jgi:putative membrane protein
MLRAILFAPFLLVLIVFALSNQQPVSLTMWPTDVVLVEVPLSIAVLVIAAIFFLLGALLTWLPGLRHRRRAHVAERRVRSLEADKAAREAPVVVSGAPRLAGPVIDARRAG